MKKKSKTKKIPTKFYKTLLALIISLILTYFGWMTESALAVQFPATDQPIELYSNQTRDDLRQIYLKAIGEAKSSVLLIIYSLTDDKIIQALRQKAEEGIDVHVICYAPESLPELNEQLGSQVKLLKRFARGLMHLKILVIDQKQNWIGSANMTTASLRMHGNLILALESEALAHLLQKKAESFTELERKELFPYSQYHVGEQNVEFWFLPDNRDASLRIKEMIRSANKTIRVAMFTWTREDFAKTIIDAYKRGVDVQVVIDRNQASGTGAKIAAMFKKAKIPMRVNQGQGLLHHKFLYVDGNQLLNGSANWTNAAFNKNDDCFLIMHPLIEKQSELMDALWNNIWSDSA